MPLQVFLGKVMTEAGTIPTEGLALIALAALFSVVLDVFLWTHGGRLIAADYIGLAVLMLAWVAAAYGAAMTAGRSTLSVGGLARFALASFLMLMPMLAALGLLVYAAREQTGAAPVIAMVLLLAGAVLTLGLLPAWPVAAAVAGRMVGPARVLAASRGHRWALVATSFAASGLNRLVPKTPEAANGLEALGFALVGGLVSAITLLLAVSTGVTAWKVACEQDDGLAIAA